MGKLEGKSCARGPTSQALPLVLGTFPWVQHRLWSCFQREPVSPHLSPQRHAPFVPKHPNGRIPVKPLLAAAETTAEHERSRSRWWEREKLGRARQQGHYLKF